MSGSERARLCRQRQRDGRAVLRIEVDADRLALALELDGLLTPLNADDRSAVITATERALAAYIISVLDREGA
jgi:hypothetical protein